MVRLFGANENHARSKQIARKRKGNARDEIHWQTIAFVPASGKGNPMQWK